jgi:NitT/TauT family transport system ATP-binding protein
MEPDLFLFDEPFGALDAITRERLNDELLRLYESQSFTGVFVTHSISEAVYLSSRVVVMSGRPGRVVAEHRVPFAYPRSPELRFDPRFLEVSHAVSSSMRGDY